MDNNRRICDKYVNIHSTVPNLAMIVEYKTNLTYIRNSLLSWTITVRVRAGRYSKDRKTVVNGKRLSSPAAWQHNNCQVPNDNLVCHRSSLKLRFQLIYAHSNNTDSICSVWLQPPSINGPPDKTRPGFCWRATLTTNPSSWRGSDMCRTGQKMYSTIRRHSKCKLEEFPSRAHSRQ